MSIALVTVACTAEGITTGSGQIAALALVAVFTFAFALLARLFLPFAQSSQARSRIYVRSFAALLLTSYAATAAILVWHAPCVAPNACVLRYVINEHEAVQEL